MEALSSFLLTHIVFSFCCRKRILMCPKLDPCAPRHFKILGVSRRPTTCTQLNQRKREKSSLEAVQARCSFPGL
ncbi:hypothetical protein BX666DRAFT_1972192, partial [Dichotomocladium elegans]